MARTNVRHGVRKIPKKGSRPPFLRSTAMHVTSGTVRLAASSVSIGRSVQSNNSALFDLNQSIKNLQNLTIDINMNVDQDVIDKFIELIGLPPAKQWKKKMLNELT